MPLTSRSGQNDDRIEDTGSGTTNTLTATSTTVLAESGKDERQPAIHYGEMLRKWPKTTFLIVTNEICERFSYYGMRTVLTLYFLNVLRYNDTNSTMLFNCFTSLCYFSPLFGSILADAFIGKFKTIVWLSIFYTLGQVLLAVSSIFDPLSNWHPWADFAGLIIIAIGTGGIKPCVSSFGGDQFPTYQVTMISLFFSVFYFAINIGSMIATFVAPIFRANPCLGQDTCYPLAFGVPALLMIVSTIIFVAGSWWYKKPAVQSNVMKDVVVVVGKAVRNKISSATKRSHWLDYSLNHHDCQMSAKCIRVKRAKRNPNACAEQDFVNEVKTMFKVAVMFIPIPIYWALSDQQGSTWLIQSLQMDCRLWEGTILIPDQMQSLNSILVLIFIPIFSGIFYPLGGKFVRVTPLRKMGLALVLTSMAFISAGFVQLQKTLPDLPSDNQAFVSIINTLPSCSISVKTDGNNLVDVRPLSTLRNEVGERKLLEVNRSNVLFQLGYEGESCPELLPTSVTINISSAVGFMQFGRQGVFYSGISTDKPTEGTGEFSMGLVMSGEFCYVFSSFSVALDDVTKYDKNLALCRIKSEEPSDHPCNPESRADFYFYQAKYDGNLTDIVGIYPYLTKTGQSQDAAVVFTPKAVRPGKWRLYYLDGIAKGDGKTLSRDDVNVSATNIEFFRNTQGGVYVMALSGNKGNVTATEFRVVPHNVVSILWQIPQIVLISFAEIMLSIPGLEFSYQEAAHSMKSVMSMLKPICPFMFIGAFFQVTTGVGDLLIVIITAMNLSNNAATMFFIYASLMALASAVFILMAIFYYEYTKVPEGYSDIDDEDEKEPIRDYGAVDETGSVNRAFFLGPDDEKTGHGFKPL